MRSLSSALLLCATLLYGLDASAAEPVLGQPLLTTPIDQRNLVELVGNTRPEATTANDRGALPADFALDHMHLQLRRAPSQERVVEAYIDALGQRGSPTYHKWLTAIEFGQRFGTAPADLEKITGWLRSQGFTVNFVYASHMVIDFSGTAGLVAQAFHAPMHRLEVNGVGHIANMANPQIPAALAPAVAGIVSLNDFRARKQVVVRPDVSGCVGRACKEYDLGAGDMETIYDLKPLFQQGITGQGVVVGVPEDSDLYTLDDWVNFRGAFGLRAYPAGSLVQTNPAPTGGSACTDPGHNSADDETTLDAEWVSAAAPSAEVLVAACADTQTNEGFYIAMQNLLNGSAPPPVLSLSYAICEAYTGATSNAAYNSLYQQAVSQGVSVFVASGDTGPSNCTPNVGPTGTSYGIGVNGFGTTQYNVSVGGTDFGDNYQGTTAQYWRRSSGPPWSTAISYIPEIAWNGTCASPLKAASAGFSVTYGSSGYCNSSGAPLSVSGGGGGPSSCYSGTPTVANETSGTCKGYPKPSWQKGVIGIPGDGVRDVPDVALFASNGIWQHALARCFTDPNNHGKSCAGNPVTWSNAGGTSFAAPIMAGIQALVDQHVGAPTGNPAPVYYQLAAAEYGTTGKPACYSTQGAGVGSTCIFRDVVTIGSVADGTEIDCTGTYNCYRPSGTYGVMSKSNTAYQPAFNTGVGYDLATGLGSVDAANLVNNWP